MRSHMAGSRMSFLWGSSASRGFSGIASHEALHCEPLVSWIKMKWPFVFPPLIELAWPNVGSNSQKHRQARFQTCNGARGGRLCAQLLAKHGLGFVSLVPFKTEVSEFSHPHTKLGGYLCRCPASDANWILSKGVCGSGYPFQRLSVSIMSEMLCKTRCLNCPLLGYSSLTFCPMKMLSWMRLDLDHVNVMYWKECRVKVSLYSTIVCKRLSALLSWLLTSQCVDPQDSSGIC